MRELHQPYPVVKAMPTGELILFATMAAAMSHRKF
jgi:hypothetical protein